MTIQRLSHFYLTNSKVSSSSIKNTINRRMIPPSQSLSYFQMCKSLSNDFSASSIQNISMPINVSKKIKRELEDLRFSPYKYEEFNSFINTSKEIVSQYLPETFLEIREHLIKKKISVLQITQLPIDDFLPLTPKKGGNLEEGAKSTFVLEGILLALSSIMTGCEPCNFRQEGHGQGPSLDNVVPIEALKEQKGSGGYKSNFGLHREGTFHRMSPTFLSFKGIRADHNREALTIVTPIADLLKHMNEKDIENLKKPVFTFYSPQVYNTMEMQGIPQGSDSPLIGSVLNFNEKGNLAKILLNLNGMSTEDNEAMISLKIFEGLLYQHASRFTLDSNNMVIVNNEICAHTRTGYQPRFDGYDRWFLRCYLSDKLWEKRYLKLKDLERDLGIGAEKSKELIECLQTSEMIDQNGVITEKFAQKERLFRKELIRERERVCQGVNAQGWSKNPDFLELPLKFQKDQGKIFNALLKISPAYPNRII